MLATGSYAVLLLDVLPRIVEPTDPSGYFWREQPELWGIDPFWDLPHDTRTPYYRIDDAVVGADAALFEFVVPLVPPGWLDGDTVDRYRSRLHRAALPTAVALSVLDVKQPATWTGDPSVTTHWCLAHYLLDGHHKAFAAASEGRPIRLLSYLAIEEGVSTAEDVDVLLAVLGRQSPPSPPSPVAADA